MTPEELQAEIDKIMRMAVRLEPVDLRYDVNKDGRVSSADAYLVSSGAVTIPPVTTAKPEVTQPWWVGQFASEADANYVDLNRNQQIESEESAIWRSKNDPNSIEYQTRVAQEQAALTTLAPTTTQPPTIPPVTTTPPPTTTATVTTTLAPTTTLTPTTTPPPTTPAPWWADLKYTINSSQDPNILGEVLNYPQYQAYINGKYWNKVIYNTKEEADQARQADINKARSEGRLLYGQYFFPTKEALEQAKTLSYEDPDSPAFVERKARLSKALSDAERNQKPWNQWTDYASKYGLTKDDAPEFALPELQKIDPIIKDGKDITEDLFNDLSRTINGTKSLKLSYPNEPYQERIVANGITELLNSYGVPKEKHAEYLKRAAQEDVLDFYNGTGIYTEGNKPRYYDDVIKLKESLTSPQIYDAEAKQWYAQNAVPFTRNELLQIPSRGGQYELQDGTYVGDYSKTFNDKYKDKLVEQARKKFGNIDNSSLEAIAESAFANGITDLDNARVFSYQKDGKQVLSYYDNITGRRFRETSNYNKPELISTTKAEGQLSTSYYLVPQADGTFGPQVYQEKKPGEWVQFRDEFLKPAAMFALAVVPGINTAIGSAIGFTTPAMAQAAGSFVINTAIQVASGVPIDDALKNAAIRVAVPEIIPDLTNNPFINKVIDSAATSIALGTPVETAVTNAAITIAANEISSKLDITNKLGLGSAGGKLITELAIGAMSGKPLEQILTQAAISTALSTTVDTIATENKLTPEEKAVLTVASNAAIQAARTGKINPYQLAMQLNTISGNKKESARVVASEAQNLPRSNTAIGAIAVDGKGELYTMDDDGNRMSLTGVDAGRVYTPDEWTSVQTALNAGQAQYVNSLIGAMNNGTMKPEEVVQDLKSAGYSDDTISKIQQANQQFIDRANKAQQLAKDYSEVGSDIDRDNAIKQLEGLGFNPADATKYIDNIDRQVTARNDYANIARDFVANNLGTSEQAITKLRTSLANVGVTGDQQDEVVDAYNKMRLQAAGADLTPSEMTNLAVLAANKTNWVALPGKSGHEVAFALTDEGDPYVVAARDKDGNNLLNVYQNLTPQGVMQVVNAQLAQSRAAEQTKGAPNQYAVDKEISDAASAAGLVRTTGMIRNNFSTVNTDYFNNLLRQYSAMSPEDRAKIASASGVTTDLRVLKDIDAQYKAIDQQYAAAVANNSPAAKLYKSLDTRVENKAGYYYTNNGVQPSTAMAMAVQDLQGGNLFNRVNLSEVQDSKFPFETKEFINQFRGTPAGDTLANVLSSAYAVAGSAAANTLNGALGINLHIAEAMGMDTFANDFRKLATGIKTAGDDAIAIANASTDAHKNLIGGLSNVVSAIPWLATGVAPGIVVGAMATTYGNEYIQGRLAGQSIDDAGKRATLMAIAEGIGERIGADEAVRLLKPLWRTTPTDQLGKVIGDSLVNQIGKYGTKEQLGELLSYSLQAGVDKAPQIGLAQDMTGMEFIKGALDTIQQTFVAAGANSGLAIGLRGNMTQDNSGAIKVISPDGSQGLVELGNGSVIRVDIPEGLDLKVGEDININALMHDAVYVPDNVNERFNTLESQLKNIYQTELGRPPTFAELDFNVRRLADGTDILAVANELNNSQAGQLLDQRNTFNAQTDQQIAANAKSLLDQGRTTYAEFKSFMETMGLDPTRQLNVLDIVTPRSSVQGTVTSIINDKVIVAGKDGKTYTLPRTQGNYSMQNGDEVILGVSTIKPDAEPTVEIKTKVTEKVTGTVTQKVTDSVTEPVTDSVTEKVTDEVTQKVTDSTVDQAEIDKIMRMAVGLEPVDLRYDVNKDGKVTSSDAYLVYTGAAKIPTVQEYEAQQKITEKVTDSVTEKVTDSVTDSVTDKVTDKVTDSVTDPVTDPVTDSVTDRVTDPVTDPVTDSVTDPVTDPVTDSVTNTIPPIVITTTSLPPPTTTVTVPPVTTTEPPTTTRQVVTTTMPPTTTLPPTTTTEAPTTTQVVTTTEAPTTTAVVTTTAAVTTTTAKPVTTTVKPPTTTAKPVTTAATGSSLFPFFGLPAVSSQQTTYIDYAQPKVSAPEFGPYDLFKAPSYLRPLQDSGNFGLAALIGAASESQQRNGDNQSQQNAESQGQAPTG